ncbi:cytosol aminopeptidase family, catalytic domain-containing protein [Pilobolus umbonatus]|nr:cytosol aminopeptidase family, catalytic domain-containing protein [Pilobolus umbonatus]
MFQLKSLPVRNTKLISRRLFSNTKQFDSLILGAYTGDKPTLTAVNDISKETRQLIEQQLVASNLKKANEVRVMYNIGGIQQVAVVSLGKKADIRDEKEAARKATSLGLQVLRSQGSQYVGVDVSVSAQGAGEGSVLSQFSFDKLKKEKKEDIRLEPWVEENNKEWTKGQIYGAAQNVARMLMTSPGNLMTPKLFADEVAYLLAGLENIEVFVRTEEWVAKQKMNSFMAVSQGSDEPLRFLEIHYKGGNKEDRPHGLVGKGVTFDAGGISLKPSNNMALMKGDMGGAAVVVGALYGICKLKLPVNIVAAIPLCENMPSGKATKPGDVVRAMNGKSIEVLDTDAEGRMILADALYYLSSVYSPKSLIDLATLTGAIDVALGNVYAGVFSNSNKLWNDLEKAGKSANDPFWRMPLDDGYLVEMKESHVADLNNLGKGRSGGACSAASFLKEFVDGADKLTDTKYNDEKEPALPWAHIDIAGVMDSQGTDGYHIKGMSGRPTRSLIEYMDRVSQ